MGTVVKLKYCSQASAPDLSLIPKDSGSWHVADSAFHSSEAGKMCTLLAAGQCCLHNYAVNCPESALALWGGM